MIEKKNITGIVLTGGTSTRMGSDKALMEINGVSFAQRIISKIKPLVDTVLIVSDHPEHISFNEKRVEDIIKNAGPLAGIHTGLKYSRTEYNLIVSCDVPFISIEVLKLLILNIDDKYDVIQILSGGKTMPLVAVYHTRCEEKIKQLLNEGERRVRFAVARLKTKSVVLENEMTKAITNINTLEELNNITDAVTN